MYDSSLKKHYVSSIIKGIHVGYIHPCITSCVQIIQAWRRDSGDPDSSASRFIHKAESRLANILTSCASL